MKLLATFLLATAAFAQCTYTAVYPGAVATDANLFIARDNVQTTLSLPMGVGDSTATVVSATGWQPFMIATVGIEKMLVTNVVGKVLSVTRAFSGTVAVAHNAQSIVSAFIDCDFHEAVKSEVKSIEQTLGPNLSRLGGLTNFTALGGKPAVAVAGTVSTSGTAVSGSGTSFTTAFAPGDVVLICDGVCQPTNVGAHAGGGYFTSQPMGPGPNGELPGSLITLFGGGTTAGLNPGYYFCSPLGGGGPFANTAGHCYGVSRIIDSTHFTTVHLLYPPVGSGQFAPNIVVFGNVAHVTTPIPHGLATGANVTIAGTGNASLNGTYSITTSVNPFVLDPTMSTGFTFTTGGVSPAYFAAAAITASGAATAAPVSCAISSNVATCTFQKWPGFAVGDAFQIAGASTGTCANLNGSHTVTLTSGGDYGKVIQFAAPAVNNGTCADTGMLFGSAWTYSQNAQRAVVSSVTNNTSLTVTGGFSPNFPSGSSAQNAPENTAAFTAACNSGSSIFVTDGDYHINTVDPSNHVPTCNNFSSEWRMSGGARWVHDNPDRCGFEFLGGNHPLFTNWTNDGLFIPPLQQASCSSFPYSMDIENAAYPTFVNYKATGSTGNGLDIQYSTYPVVDGYTTEATAGGLTLNQNFMARVNNYQVRDSRDEGLAIFNEPGTIAEANGVLLTNFYMRNVFDGMQISTLADVVMSNGVIEGSWVECIKSDSGHPSSNIVQLNNIACKGAQRLGPQSTWSGGAAGMFFYDTTLLELNNVQITDSNLGGLAIWGNTPSTTAKISNLTIANPALYALNLRAKRMELANIYAEEAGDSCMATAGINFLTVNGLSCKNTAKVWGNGAGSINGPNYAAVFSGVGEFHVQGLHIIDDQATATGYKILESSTATRGVLSNVSANISDAAHPLAWTIGTPQNVNVLGINGFPLMPKTSAALTIATNAIAPPQPFFHLGAGLLKTITVPAGYVTGCMDVVPDAAFTYDATGNIVVPSGGGTAVVNKLWHVCYDGAKWTPNY